MKFNGLHELKDFRQLPNADSTFLFIYGTGKDFFSFSKSILHFKDVKKFSHLPAPTRHITVQKQYRDFIEANCTDEILKSRCKEYGIKFINRRYAVRMLSR